MSLLRVAVLGSPEVFHGKTRLIFSLRKALALLIYLTVEGGMHSRSKLAAFLWPDSDPHDARTALRNAIALLRNLLVDADSSSLQPTHLLSEHDLLGLNPDAALDLDLDMIQQAWKQAQELPAFPPEEQRVVLMSTWQYAISQVRGPFLEGFWLREESPFNEWLQSQQHQWQVRLQLLFDRLSSWQEAAGEHDHAITTLIRWQTLDPLQEEVYRRLMRLYLAQGNPTAALQAYITCQTRLAEELQVQPSPATSALAEHIRTVATTPFIDSIIEADVLPNEPSVPFVGRAKDFTRLVTDYQQARHGQPRATLLIGEAGIGKTRLATEFVTWARAQGADILSGQAFEMGGRLPYQMLVEALRQRLDEENAPEDLLDDPWLAELARILPELRVRYPDLPNPADDELTTKVRLFEAVARLLDALAQRAPLVLLLDDLHWADGASLDLVRYLVHYWKGHRTHALLLGTVRSEDLELNHLLITQLADLGRDVHITQITLQTLNQVETICLIQALVGREKREERKEKHERSSDQLVTSQLMTLSAPKLEMPEVLLGRSLFALTGGHPFYLIETLKMLQDKGQLTPTLDSDGKQRFEIVGAKTQEYSWRELLPPSVRAMILARQAMLSSNARQLLMACAILGEQATARRLWQITELGMQIGVDALEEAVRSGVLREEEAGENRPSNYRFAHNLIREVIYTEIGEARRYILHQRAFMLLKAEGASAAELAYHALAADKVSEAYQYSIQAGDDAVIVFAVEDAVAHYEQARSLIREHVEQTMLELHQKSSAITTEQDVEQWQQVNQATFPEVEHLYAYLGRAYSFLNNWERARDAYEDLLTYAHYMHQPALVSITLNRLAILEIQQSNDRAKVRALLEEAWRVAQISHDQRALTETEWNQAQMAIVWGNAKQALLHGQHARKQARESNNKELEARSLYSLGIIYFLMGNLQKSMQSMEAALALYAVLSKEQSTSRELSLTHFMIGAPTTQYLTNCASEALSLGLLALAQIYSGDLHNGIHNARMAVLLSKEIKNTWVQINSTVYLIYGLLEAGVYEEAFILTQQVADLVQAIPLKVIFQSVLIIQAGTYQVLQQQEEARNILAGDVATREMLDLGLFRGPTLSLLCVSSVLTDEWEQAYRFALMSVDTRNSQHVLLPTLDLYRHYETEALLRGGSERLAREEVQSFGERLGHYSRQRIPYLRSLAILARWDEQRDQAIEYLHEAAQIAEELGLPGEQWQIQAELGACYDANRQQKQAHNAFGKAAMIILGLAENIKQERLRAQFLAQPQIQRIVQGHLTPTS